MWGWCGMFFLKGREIPFHLPIRVALLQCVGYVRRLLSEWFGRVWEGKGEEGQDPLQRMCTDVSLMKASFVMLVV